MPLVPQQLNFYAFRKIKYADTIRIDPKLEAETANYWRFRHEKFQRGKPELLQEIKRMNGQKGSAPSTNSNAKKTTVSSSLDKENSALKSEVTQLKTKLEQMTKNIDDLTKMVQKVSLQQQQEPTPTPPTINQNNKRTKVEDTPMPPLPDIPFSRNNKMEVDDFVLPPPSIPSPVHPTLSTSETPSDLSDDTFVDQLFTAFKTENFDFEEPVISQPPTPPKSKNHNRPKPELMNKLSDALEVLPTQIQELIVNRLVQAITSPMEIQDSVNVQSENSLAAATLATLLSQYGEDAIKAAAAHAKDSHKALLIPVHA
eukprot:scaffold3254_cov98-Cylindrotheca_fusiformis.AAC.3